MIYQKYILDMTPDTMILPLVYVSQFDDGGRTIVFIMKNRNADYTPTDVKVMIDGNEIPCTVSGNEVSFLVDSSLTNFAETYKGEVVDGSVGSCNFRFRVDPTTYVDDGPEPEDMTEYNQALSIILGRTVDVSNPKKALSILQGE